MPEKSEFAVHCNQPRLPYVMAFICPCGKPCVAFGDDAFGMFTGDRCGRCGAVVSVMAS